MMQRQQVPSVFSSAHDAWSKTQKKWSNTAEGRWGGDRQAFDRVVNPLPGAARGCAIAVAAHFSDKH